MNLFLIFLRLVDSIYTCLFGFNESDRKSCEFEASIISEDVKYLIKSNITESQRETQLESQLETQLESQLESQREDQFEILSHDIIENYDSSLSNQLI